MTPRELLPVGVLEVGETLLHGWRGNGNGTILSQVMRADETVSDELISGSLASLWRFQF